MYKVTSVTPNLLQIEIVDIDLYHAQPADSKLSIGSYLKISDDRGLMIIAIAQSFRIRDAVNVDPEVAPSSPTFMIEAQQVGCFDGVRFRRGGQQIAIPPTDVELATTDDLARIYGGVAEAKKFSFGFLAQNEEVRVVLDGDRFFGKHIGVVGSTGSGKSCGVAKILQEGIRQSAAQAEVALLNNSHVIIFDLHGEYAPAFPGASQLSIDNMVLPYWLMNSEELEEMFIESQDQNSHNQVSQFKFAVTENKKLHNPGLSKVNYDTPVYFSISEVCRYICNQNLATKDAATGRLSIKDRDLTVSEHVQMFREIAFDGKVSGKINGGPYAGEFDRFLSRLETKLNDERLGFLLQPVDEGGEGYGTGHLPEILRQFTGYRDTGQANVTIIDLSGIPFDVLSVVVSLISRLIFDFCFHFKKSKVAGMELPFLLVYEEAHNYIPQSERAKYGSVKKSIERIAKEGRKYGISLMIVSQRPSEISETIFSQCNNFVAMRLTNPTDQHYIKRLLPDSINAITDALPTLDRQEAIILGDAVSVPSIVKIDEISDKPNSRDIEFHTEWKKDWLAIEFDNIIQRMKRQPTIEVCE